MKRTLILLMSMVGTLLSFANDAMFTADSAYYDLGVLAQEDTLVTHTFEFCNETADTMLIKRVEPTCLFTINEYTTDSIAPDQTAQITVTLNTRELYGNFSKHFYVYGTMPTMRLSLYGSRNAVPTYSEEDYSQIPEVKTSKRKKRR